MGIKHDGFGRAVNMLRSSGDRIVDATRGQMKRAANRIVTKAKLYVPEDTQDLMKSIRIEKTYGTRGRLQIDIVAGGVTGEVRGINLDAYAALVHEAYETAIAYVNGPGPGTLAKMAANPGVLIGSRFLARAAEEEDKKLEDTMISELSKVIRETSQ